jgi:hypothetical protein
LLHDQFALLAERVPPSFVDKYSVRQKVIPDRQVMPEFETEFF